MWRWADVKMSRCERRCERRYDEESEQMREDVREDVREDMKMSRCEDEQMWEKMWRWADVKMSRCEDEKVWRWEGEIQTPTIGRTLRSDALGKNVPNHQPDIYIYTHRFSMGNALNISPAWTVESCWDHTLLDLGGCRDKTQKSILTGTIEWGCLKFGGRPYS